MSDTKKMGVIGEKITADYLRKKGYIIFKKNYHSKFGEIDIIAEKDNLIAFVEVKTRTENALVSGTEAVDKQKQKKIILTAKDFIPKLRYEHVFRFDVAEVIISEDKKRGKINYIKNAFLIEKHPL